MQVNLIRYGIVVILVSFLIQIIAFLFERFLGLGVSNSGTMIIPFFLAAMVEGQLHAKKSRDPIVAPWKQAGILTLVGLLVSVVLAVPLLVAQPEVVNIFAQIGIWALVAFFVVFGVIFVANRIFLSFGANQTWKALDKQKK